MCRSVKCRYSAIHVLLQNNVTSFLQLATDQVTSKMDQKQYWTGDQNKYQYHTIENFAESFRTSYLPLLVEDKLCSPNNTGKNKEVKVNAGRRVSRWNIFKACFSRELLLLKRNSPVHIFKTIQITVMALVISTLFLLQAKRATSIARMGTPLFSLPY